MGRFEAMLEGFVLGVRKPVSSVCPKSHEFRGKRGEVAGYALGNVFGVLGCLSLRSWK
jgi:hypothetical protein